MNTMTVKEVLIAARAKIADPANWTQGACARDVCGGKTFSSNNNAVCWCSLGALAPGELRSTLTEAAAALASRQPVAQELSLWRNHGAAIDAKALATATEIALMWGKDRSQFVSRIQVAVIDAMRWMGDANPPAQGIDLGQFREAVELALEVPIKDRSQRQRLEKLLALIDGKAVVK